MLALAGHPLGCSSHPCAHTPLKPWVACQRLPVLPSPPTRAKRARAEPPDSPSSSSPGARFLSAKPGSLCPNSLTKGHDERKPCGSRSWQLFLLPTHAPAPAGWDFLGIGQHLFCGLGLAQSTPLFCPSCSVRDPLFSFCIYPSHEQGCPTLSLEMLVKCSSFPISPLSTSVLSAPRVPPAEWLPLVPMST